MTYQHNMKFEIETFPNLIGNYDKSNKPELNLDISIYSKDSLANSSHAKNIITDGETFSTLQLGTIPDITLSKSMPLENNINLKENDKFPKQKMNEEINFKKEDQEIISHFKSNLILASSSNTQNKWGKNSSAVSPVSNINMEKNLHSLSLLKELNKKSSEQENDGKSGNKLTCQDNANISKQGRWTPEEHLKFIQALWLFGSEWKKVQDYVGTRSSSQARSHSQKFFIRLKRRLESSNFFKGLDSINEQNFSIVIDWINESLDKNHLYFLNSKKLTFDDSAKRFCRVIVNLMNTTGDNKSRRQSDASIFEKIHEKIWDGRVFEKNDGQKFNKFGLMEEKSFNMNNLQQINFNNKIKIPLHSDHLDDYFNFSHSDSLSQGSMNLERKKSSNKNDVEDIFQKHYSDIRKASDQNTYKIFEIKKDKIAGECSLKQTTKRSSDILKKGKKKSSSNRSRLSSVTDSKWNRNEGNQQKNKKQFDNIPPIKIRKNPDRSNIEKPKLDNSNHSKAMFDNLSATAPGINSSSNPNIFIDPNKNNYFHIVNFNYGCNDNKAEEKTNPITYNNNLINNISGNPEGVPINNFTNYTNKINSIYNAKCSNSEHEPDTCFVKQNRASYENRTDNSNNNFQNFLAAQKMSSHPAGNNPNNYFNNNEAQSSQYHAPANNELNKNVQLNLLYQMLCYRNQHQTAMLNQYNCNSHSNVPQFNNASNGFNPNFENTSNKCNSCSGCFHNQANAQNYINHSVPGYKGPGKKKKNKADNTKSSCERGNRNTVASTHNSQSIKSLRNMSNYENFANFNQDYMNINKDLLNINPMNQLKFDSIGQPLNHKNNITTTNVGAYPYTNSLYILQNNIKFDEAKSNNKESNPFNITFPDKKPSNEECFNIFSSAPDIRNLLKSEKDKEEDILHNFDLSEYFKADGY